MYKAIVFIDSECVLCENTARLLLTIDRKNRLRIAPLGGKTYVQITGTTPNHKDYQYVKLYIDGKMYKGPEVFFKLVKILGFPYNMLMIFNILPKRLQWILYNYIAKNRYQWFGKKEHCSIGTPTRHKKILP